MKKEIDDYQFGRNAAREDGENNQFSNYDLFLAKSGELSENCSSYLLKRIRLEEKKGNIIDEYLASRGYLKGMKDFRAIQSGLLSPGDLR